MTSVAVTTESHLVQCLQDCAAPCKSNVKSLKSVITMAPSMYTVDKEGSHEGTRSLLFAGLQREKKGKDPEQRETVQPHLMIWQFCFLGLYQFKASAMLLTIQKQREVACNRRKKQSLCYYNKAATISLPYITCAHKILKCWEESLFQWLHQQ